MGLATLNVWIHDKTDPCKIDDGVFWFVSVTYCNGQPVKWCGHTYSGELAKCGHVELQLPPGCYVVRALQFFPKIFFNLTDHAIVVVGCDEKACVHLYTPTDRQRPGSASLSARFLAATKGLPPKAADKFVAACDALLKDLPQTARDTAIEQLLKDLEDAFAKNPPQEGGSK